MKKIFPLLFVCLVFFVSGSLMSCEETQVLQGTPYVDAPLRAMRMEQISISTWRHPLHLILSTTAVIRYQRKQAVLMPIIVRSLLR